MKQPSFLQSLKHAWAGVIFTIRTQRNAKIHLLAGIATLAFAWMVGLTTTHLSILALTIGGVIACELINTAVEAMVDLLSPEWHERAKVAKDAAAGAVLALSITAVIVGLLILGPPLWRIIEALIKSF